MLDVFRDFLMATAGIAVLGGGWLLFQVWARQYTPGCPEGADLMDRPCAYCGKADKCRAAVRE